MRKEVGLKGGLLKLGEFLRCWDMLIDDSWEKEVLETEERGLIT